MSHATVIAAVDAPFRAAVVKELEKQMAPFNEGGTALSMFRDGSRWDWYEIGGRWTSNIGGVDVVQRKDLDTEQLMAHERKSRECRVYELWEDPQFLKHYADGDERLLLDVWGVQPGESRDDVVKRVVSDPIYPLAGFAFLRDLAWYENERMGWWGQPAPTECEIGAKNRGEEYQGRCIYQDKGSSARIIVYGDPPDVWNRRFWPRFIERLGPETWIVNVDFHV